MQSFDGTPGWLRPALALLFAGALAQYAWNAFHVTALTGFDGPAHAGYIATVALDGRLPLPREGWSTFHPPFYYLISAAVWWVFDAAGPRALLVALRAISVLAIFASAAAVVKVLLDRRTPAAVVCVAAAVVLFVPVSQLAGTFIGNEALGVGLASLAIAAILRLQADPGDRNAALAAGAFAGFAMATKYTGIFVAVGCLVPFARTAAWPQARRTLPWLLAALFLLGGPVYLRNVVLTGSPVPMTRDEGFHAKIEEGMTLRPRELRDFGIPSFEVLRRPTLFHVEGEPQPGAKWNESMQNVWGLGYATIWYDGAGHRIQARFHNDDVPWGPLLCALGLVPTLLTIVGFGHALREAAARRLDAPDAPLVVMGCVGLVLFVAFTVRAPAIVAAKGSYLLPLLVPAAVFFARGVALLPGVGRVGALVVSAAAALVAAWVFASDAVFPPIPAERVFQGATILDRVYPTAHIGDGVDHLLPGRPRTLPGRM